MKCGTTWLHDALNTVDGVVIPREEVHWIDAHDPLSHPDFQMISNEGLKLRRGADTRWHTTSYLGHDERGLLGYDSTTLFHSHIDLREIARTLSQTKFIVILRDPVSRAYSHYWHLVRTGRAYFPFEKEILHGRQEILTRSLYAQSAERMIDAFGDRVLFVCYEKTFAEPDGELRRIVDFLELPEAALDTMRGHLDSHSNPGRYPRHLRGWLFMSRLLAGWEQGRYAMEMPSQKGGRSVSARMQNTLYHVKLAAMVLAAGGIHKRSPKMKPTTRAELTAYLEDANSRLDNLTGQSFSTWWGRARNASHPSEQDVAATP